MPEFLRTKLIVGCLERLIAKAKKQIVLVTYNVGLSSTFEERLRDALSRGVECTLIFRHANPAEAKLIGSLHGLHICHLDCLHAKCYLNEQEAIVTSMNLSRFSEDNNREMGIRIIRDRDPDLFDDISAEVESIMEHASLVRMGEAGNARTHSEANKDDVRAYVRDMQQQQMPKWVWAELDGELPRAVDALVDKLRVRLPDDELDRHDWGIVIPQFRQQPLQLEIRPRQSHVRIELHPLGTDGYKRTRWDTNALLVKCEQLVSGLEISEMWANHRVVMYVETGVVERNLGVCLAVTEALAKDSKTLGGLVRGN